MPHSRRYRYTVKVLTPLHIGSGGSIPGSTYHVSDVGSGHYIWTRLNLEAAGTHLFSTYKTANPSLESVAQFARENLDTYSMYQLAIAPGVARFLRHRDVLEHLKLYGKPYLPGSSLKGAIRTAVLGAFLSEGNREAFENALKESLKDQNVQKQRLADKAQEAVWSEGPHFDPFRGLRLGDSDEGSPHEHLTISDVRIVGLNTSPHLEAFWEKLGRRQFRAHRPTPRGATKLFVETLLPGTKLTGELSFNTFLLEESWVKKQQDFEAQAELLQPERLRQVCQQKYDELFRQELALYQALEDQIPGQFTRVVENLAHLQKEEAPESNEFFLQLAWGAGWQAKTVADQLDQRLLYEEVNTIQRFFQDPPDRAYALADFRVLTRGQRRLLSPKTRHLVMEGDTPVYPLGWVKVSLQEA